MIYKFRVILDTEEDVFRDIEIEAEHSFEDFHTIIRESFGFKGNEMASFYVSDDYWIQGTEIMLFAMDEDSTDSRIMRKTLLKEFVSKAQDKLIYIYDFLALWTFYITLIKTDKKVAGKTYPNLLRVHGTLPEISPKKQFEGEALSSPGTTDNDPDIHNYDNSDFEGYWN
ncbi:MAG: hypothetical protein AAF934_02545 [Bacteroidota bacterium]